MFIVFVSVPLAVALVLMLRRACPLRPGLTATLGGLASAAAAATLLNLFHPFDVAATDLASTRSQSPSWCSAPGRSAPARWAATPRKLAPT